jgi:hypothetical protein
MKNKHYNNNIQRWFPLGAPIEEPAPSRARLSHHSFGLARAAGDENGETWQPRVGIPKAPTAAFDCSKFLQILDWEIGLVFSYVSKNILYYNIL